MQTEKTKNKNQGKRVGNETGEAPDKKRAKMSNLHITEKILGKHSFALLAKTLYEENLGVLFTSLEIDHSVIKRHKDEESNISDRILRSLNYWKNMEKGKKTPPEMQLNKLYTSLRFIGRQDLVDAINNQGHDETEDVEEQDEDKYSNGNEGGSRKRIRSHSRSCKGAEELFSDRGFDFVSRKLGKEWFSFMINLGMEASRLEQHRINHQHVQLTIFCALKEWSEKVKSLPYEQKKTFFFKKLENEERRDLIDEIANKFKIEDIRDSYQTAEDDAENIDDDITVGENFQDDSQEESGPGPIPPKMIRKTVNTELQDEWKSALFEVPRLAVTGIVVKKSPKLLFYKNSNGETKFYFNLICKSGSDFYFLRNYCCQEFNDIYVGDTYRFEELVKHKDELWVVQKDSVAVKKREMETFKGEIPCLPEEEPLEGVKRPLSEALTTARRSTVIAKIIKVSEVSYAKNGKLPVRKLALMDDERNVAKLVLFGAMTEYQVNTIVKVTAVYVTSFKGKEELRLTRDSRIEKMDDGYQTLREKLIPDQNELFCDSDFFGENLETYEIDSIYSAKEYECCSYCEEGQIKLKDDVCPRCQRSGKGEKGCVVKIGLVSPDGTRDKIVIFKSNTSILFGTTEFVSRNELKDYLPVSFEGKLSSDKTLSDITNVKRSRPSCSKDD